MASRARFGRLPKSAPSLTSTIVALAQEYQRVRDKNIEEAWKNGGQFEGKKVTDKMFLSYWKERKASVSTDDPMWDYYNNQIYGYEFLIEESEMGLKYERGTIKEAAMASFYKKWANKMPRQSQNWRMLMTQAAKFKSAVASRGRARSSQSRTDNYVNAQNRTMRTEIQPRLMLMQAVMQQAMWAEIIDKGDYEGSMDGGWSKIKPTHQTDFADLLDKLSSNEAWRRNTEKWIQDNSDPKFKLSPADLTNEGITNLLQDGAAGAATYARRARKNGRKTDTDTGKNLGGMFSDGAATVRIMVGDNKDDGFFVADQFQRSQMDEVLSNPESSVAEKTEAVADYRKWLTTSGVGMLDKVFTPQERDRNNPATFNAAAAGVYARLQSTVDALDGKDTGLTFRDDPLSLSTGNTGSDSQLLTKTAKELKAANDLLKTGKGITVRVDDNGNVVSEGGYISVIPRNEVDMSEMVPYTSKDGTTMYAKSVPVRVKGYELQDPTSGVLTKPLKPFDDRSDEVGRMAWITGPDGSPMQVWGVQHQRSDGTFGMGWMTDNPFKTDNFAGMTVDSKGATLNFMFGSDPQWYDPDPEKRTKPGYDPRAVMGPVLPKGNKGVRDGDENIYDTPAQAVLNSDPVTGRQYDAMGRAAIEAEREYWSDPNKWTPAMQRELAAGYRPENIIARKVADFEAQMYKNRTQGYGPDERKKYREQQDRIAGMQRAADRQKAERDAAALASEAKRNSLIRDASDYLDNPPPIPGMAGPIAQKPEKLKNGWDVKSLLTQPGMSDAQAADLAYQITKGRVGKRLPTEKEMARGETFVSPLADPYTRAKDWIGDMFAGIGAPAANPYADKYKNTTGPNFIGPPTPVKAAPPKVEPKKPEPKKPEPTAGPRPTPKPPVTKPAVAPKPPPTPNRVPGAPGSPVYGPPAPVKPQYGPPAPNRVPGAPGSPVYGPPAPTKPPSKPLYGPWF